MRSLLTIGVVWLLNIPGRTLVGGLGLVWIAYKLLMPQSGKGGHDVIATTFWAAMRTIVTADWAAMRTIVTADALMGVDNVLGVAGVASGSFDQAGATRRRRGAARIERVSVC